MLDCVANKRGSGQLQIVLSDDGDELWSGLLVATAHEHHASLQKEFPALKPHTMLRKWLYLPQTHPSFEEAAAAIVDVVRRGDPRIGVEPKPRKRKRVSS
ncbi:MAG: hypothetical protein A2583_13980 [Bdellovibrionales bacterium RIFOXYD1_FULL_53_11]|nr:MAG: hypothetical protein A2583_13980 [Bdellovibrionales bacterium RIFOXYD1_FULL_53_11]